MLWLVGAVLAMALLGASACGEDPPSLVEPPLPAEPATLVGSWEGTRTGGYKLRYEFRRDGTYRHFSGLRQRRRRGTYSFAIKARGMSAVRGHTLILRPRGGTIARHDPEDPSGDFERPVDKKPQRYRWSVRGSGRKAKLTLTIGGRLAVTYRRR